MKIEIHHIVCFTALLLTCSCGKSIDPDGPAAVQFNISSVAGPAGSKALVEDANNLISACTPTANGGLGQSIGIWADAIVDGTQKKNVFNGTQLIWEAVGSEGHEGHPDDAGETASPSFWNYKTNAVYWRTGEEYTFRAFYPYDEMKDGLQSWSDATGFVVVYEAEKVQEDFMVAYAHRLVDVSNLATHVDFDMIHALSALRFTFNFAPGFDMTDNLTSFWIENTRTDNTQPDQFADMGMMVYGESGSGNEEKMTWQKSYSPLAGTKMFYWKNNDATETYVFSRSESSTTAATAYGSDDASTECALFAKTENQRWLFVPPQQLVSGTKLCFTTRTGGTTVFKADLPTTLNWTEGGVAKSSQALEPGYRYTFNIVISKLDAEVLVTIRPWNIRNSSYYISF